ncbi:uncharacterized protein LOC119831238 [Zerene cesonia]|uniref:uncharacterized protein LOC119831238 n=1 Tax=Zerene cesonia TaxID=33412 RepID=UPI0018E4F5DD|nr:uncharacterized protein LOC119831238 [Zerene cesonia]
MKQVINVLKEWVKMQPHFKKKDFADSYLERCIVASKGSVEKAKIRLDKICTMRTLMPEFFENIDIAKDCKELFDTVILTICPKLTKEHQRVFVIKTYRNVTHSNLITLFYKYGVYQGYGLKIKGIHIVSDSKGVDIFVNIIKQLLKTKLASRISTHKTFEEVHDIVGKEVLPVELGGYEKSIKEIHDDWLSELSKKENIDYMREMNKAGVDVTLRPRHNLNDDYVGMPGTFRVLSVD